MPHHAENPSMRSLAVKFGLLGCVLLPLSLLAIGLTLWLTWQLEGGAAAINEAGRMRMQTWRLAQLVSTGDAAQMAARARQFDRSLALLYGGDPSRPLAVPHDAASREALAEVARRWQALRGDWTAAPAPADGAEAARRAESLVAVIDTFVGSIERQLARWTTLLNSAQLAMMVLAVVVALALLYVAQLMIFGPLARLRTGLASLEAGDLSARVDARGDDELSAVAQAFNRMAARLQDLYTGLEKRVHDKTEHLEAERARLAALHEAAAFVSRAADLPELAQGFARQMRRVARADAAAVRWSDEDNLRYVLLGADGLPPALVKAEHCMPTGACHCGQPPGSAQVRLFRLGERPASGDPGPVPRMRAAHCKDAGFVSMVSVPLRLHERIAGEIELFYRRQVTLEPEDRTLLEALASHLAGAMESLRADALQREAAVAEERSLLARELHDSIAQSLAFLKIQATLLRGEIERSSQPRSSRVQRTLGELDTGIRESLSDVRELLMHFRTRTNTEDIVPALRTTLTKFEHQSGLAADLRVEGEGMALAPDVQLQVLHVVQEALSNVRKHARARRVWVNVRQSPQWVVQVRDDGCGLPGGTQRLDETHVGLRIMHERAASIEAALDIASEPGAGTCVTLTLPPLSRGTAADGGASSAGLAHA